MKNISILLMSTAILSGCIDDDKKEKISPQKHQQIATSFHVFKKPPEPEPALKEEELEPEPIPVQFPDPKPLMREDNARKLRGLRQYQTNKTLKNIPLKKKEEQKPRLQDHDYQQWEDATFEESRSTLPVDRSRILTADMRITAILEDSVNSQVGGRMIAIVERDILSPNGKYILIPAYSRIICNYGPLEEVGQTRLSVQCKRLIRPDGVSIALKESIAADQSGRTGLIGELDQRIWEKYGAAFLISATASLAQAGSYATQERSKDTLSQILTGATDEFSHNLSEVTSQVIEKNINLAPILMIPPGSHIQIIPSSDIVLRHAKEALTQENSKTAHEVKNKSMETKTP